MDKIYVKPLDTVNGIKFGAPRSEVRAVFGEKYEEFKKSENSSNTTDDFGFCHVFYDDEDRVEAFEIFDDVEVLIDDTEIFAGGPETLLAMFDDFEDDGYGFISLKYSIGFSNDEGKIESILFGKQGYYGEV